MSPLVYCIFQAFLRVSQRAFTCSKLTVETREQGVKSAQSQQKRYQNGIIDFVLISLLLTLNIFYTFSSVSFVDLEQVNPQLELHIIFSFE